MPLNSTDPLGLCQNGDDPDKPLRGVHCIIIPFYSFDSGVTIDGANADSQMASAFSQTGAAAVCPDIRCDIAQDPNTGQWLQVVRKKGQDGGEEISFVPLVQGPLPPPPIVSCTPGTSGCFNLAANNNAPKPPTPKQQQCLNNASQARDQAIAKAGRDAKLSFTEAVGGTFAGTYLGTCAITGGAGCLGPSFLAASATSAGVALFESPFQMYKFYSARNEAWDQYYQQKDACMQ
jgi:hypothetical protein